MFKEVQAEIEVCKLKYEILYESKYILKSRVLQYPYDAL
jgi:hypothetical protein